MDKLENPTTSFYRIELPNGLVTYERLTEVEIFKHRGSEQDVITKLALEFAELKGVSNLEVTFI